MSSDLRKHVSTQSLNLRLSGNIERAYLEHALDTIEPLANVSLSIDHEVPKRYGFSLNPDLEFARSLATIISCLAALLVLWRAEQSRKKIDESQVMQRVREALLARGVVDHEFQSVEGFEALVKGDGMCVFSARDTRSGEIWRICLFPDGNTVTLRVER